MKRVKNFCMKFLFASVAIITGLIILPCALVITTLIRWAVMGVKYIIGKIPNPVKKGMAKAAEIAYAPIYYFGWLLHALARLVLVCAYLLMLDKVYALNILKSITAKR
jgi:hypothetical protein